MYPAIQSTVLDTPNGTPYLQAPGVVMISAPAFDNEGMEAFLDQFDESLGFDDYTMDDEIEGGTELCKTAGQLCYFSFGRNRTVNKDAPKYFDNIRSSGHGSVLEHANYSFLVYGVSRSFTHELVRHRVGIGYSQVSQRYVSGKTLRFVERPEYQSNDALHNMFINRIEHDAFEYDMLATTLQSTMADQLQGMAPTEKRKAVNQAARSLLPNETEAPIIFTGNVRTIRHIIEMRGSGHAEPEIRKVGLFLYRCMLAQAPILFADYEEVTLADGTVGVQTKYRKV